MVREAQNIDLYREQILGITDEAKLAIEEMLIKK
jgi:hypothetical protein